MVVCNRSGVCGGGNGGEGNSDNGFLGEEEEKDGEDSGVVVVVVGMEEGMEEKVVKKSEGWPAMEGGTVVDGLLLAFARSEEGKEKNERERREEEYI